MPRSSMKPDGYASVWTATGRSSFRAAWTPTRSRRSARRCAETETRRMQRPFSRLAIVNRGEPAMRVIHAVRELNAQREEPIRLIALYTEAERDAMFVRHADEA